MAIAFGTAVNHTTVNPGLTVSQTGPTVTGTNTFGVVPLFWQSNESASGFTVTWGGSSMTLIAEYSQESGTRRGALYYIFNPSSAATVSATRTSSSGAFAIASVYYTGVKQSGQPDSSATPSSAANTSFSPATTVVASNCWIISTVRDPSGGIAAGPGTTLRSDFAANVGPGFGDSNGTVGTGSQSMNYTGTNDVWNGVIFSMSPAGTSIVLPFKSLLGVGI